MFRVPGGKDLHTVTVQKGNMFENTLKHQARSISEGNLPKVYSLKSRKYMQDFVPLSLLVTKLIYSSIVCIYSIYTYSIVARWQNSIQKLHKKSQVIV